VGLLDDLISSDLPIAEAKEIFALDFTVSRLLLFHLSLFNFLLKNES
jgi:hypothetical protein